MEEEEEEGDGEVQFPVHPHPLTPFHMSRFFCSLCCELSSDIDCYICTTCHETFHKKCAESPLELHHHPYHPPHSLSLSPLPLTDAQASNTCSCCGQELGAGWVYHCSACIFIIHLRCANEPPALEVDQPKSHGHKLFLLPKPRPFTCDACGLFLDSPSLPWGCLECGVVIHRECIDLPRVIRISRHPQHRLCYSSSPCLPPTHESSWSCGVCRKAVEDNYGAYSCIKDDCHYVVHSKCATREDVWDGKDLEGVPEEPEDVEEPFEIIDDGVVLHFGHKHNLKLKTIDDESKHCEICALPIRIHLGGIYTCTQCQCGCDFAIHEACANLPRKIWYMLHPHRLTLQNRVTEVRTCKVCVRNCCGFMYRCCEEECDFEVDVSCASVSEPFTHITHPHHPLFSTSVSTCGNTCFGCRVKNKGYTMQCIECDFALCLECITLPSKVRYKHDRHPLVIGNGDETNCSWCEVCEGKMDPEVFFYGCDSCCVTVHGDCVLGEQPFVKPGRYIPETKLGFEVAANNSCCRPLCHQCGRRCPFPIVFKRSDLYLCTFECLADSLFSGE
ncbi:PREDICTED: uncharacterized protein LOC104823132 [Tarenaya hassleriana]|uniref:uncharacterized protein LOC104823132 n=1 Tax=Tarenaya hassleriana TaxID=28532 RepID=UPI00053C341B|nr:PREDICTED: uncharacterized protein LOC104823132 [Tarenaya hassleriana]